MPNKKICVYTCITGSYDNLKEIKEELYENSIDYYCFTNNRNIKSNTWKVIYISDDELNDHMLSRKIKILGHSIINENYDFGLYLDGSLLIERKISDFINNECDINNFEFSAIKHSVRDCIYEEGIECIRQRKDNKDIILKQLDYYRQNNYPEHYGLYEMACFIRNFKSSKVNDTMNVWFETLLKYSKRDQLSFMWAVYNTGLKINTVNINLFDNNYFTFFDHSVNNTLGSYRLYFGDINSFDVNKIFDAFYIEENNCHIIKTKILNDCKEIYLLPYNKSGLFCNKIDVNLDSSYQIINGFEIDSEYYFYNKNPMIKFIGDFKENDELIIYLSIGIIEIEDMIHRLKIKDNEVKRLEMNLKNKNRRTRSKIWKKNMQ